FKNDYSEHHKYRKMIENSYGLPASHDDRNMSFRLHFLFAQGQCRMVVDAFRLLRKQDAHRGCEIVHVRTSKGEPRADGKTNARLSRRLPASHSRDRIPRGPSSRERE